MLNNVFVISSKKANSFALCLEAAKYGEHVTLIYAGAGTERHTGQWCRSRRFHGSRIYGRLDGKAGL